jgi:hypothetical protein
MQRIPRIEERLIGYKTPSTATMELWESLSRRAMRQPHARTRFPMRVDTSKVKLEDEETMQSRLPL